MLPDQVSEFHVSQVKSNSFLCKIGSNLRVRNLFDCNPTEKEMADRVEVLFGALFFDAGFSTAKRVTTDLVREPFMRTFGMPLPYSDKPLTSFWQVSSVGAFVIELARTIHQTSSREG